MHKTFNVGRTLPAHGVVRVGTIMYVMIGTRCSDVRCRHKVSIYGSCGYWMQDLSDIGGCCDSLIGVVVFRLVKLRCGFGRMEVHFTCSFGSGDH